MSSETLQTLPASRDGKIAVQSSRWDSNGSFEVVVTALHQGCARSSQAILKERRRVRDVARRVDPMNQIQWVRIDSAQGHGTDLTEYRLTVSRLDHSYYSRANSSLNEAVSAPTEHRSPTPKESPAMNAAPGTTASQSPSDGAPVREYLRPYVDAALNAGFDVTVPGGVDPVRDELAGYVYITHRELPGRVTMAEPRFHLLGEKPLLSVPIAPSKEYGGAVAVDFEGEPEDLAAVIEPVIGSSTVLVRFVQNPPRVPVRAELPAWEHRRGFMVLKGLRDRDDA